MGLGFRVLGRFWVEGLGPRVSVLGSWDFRVRVSGFDVSGLGFEVSGLGCGVQG